jgi:hypothetical protein
MANVGINEIDVLYYSRVIDTLSSVLQISDNFYKNDGMPAVPNENIMEALILSFKVWLDSEEGADWMGTMGYYRRTTEGQFITTDLVGECEVCGSLLNKITLFKCENCGKHVCSKCSEIMDETYDIRWCCNCS